MAYIDKEEFECFFNRHEWGTCDERWRPESEFGKFVDTIPTADVAKVKHGKWTVDKTDIWGDCCSECGEIYHDASKDGYMYNYCPTCGAKMDGGDVG